MIIDKLKIALANYPSHKLAIFLRHAEKGENSLLTEEAKVDIKELSCELNKLKIPLNLYSSPELRCVQTVNILNSHLLIPAYEIGLNKFLGDPGVQIKDNQKFLKVFDKYGARGVYAQWKIGKHQDILRSCTEIRNEVFNFLSINEVPHKVSLLVSQSGTIAALEFALGIKEYNVEKGEWVSFLDGFVLQYD